MTTRLLYVSAREHGLRLALRSAIVGDDRGLAEDAGHFFAGLRRALHVADGTNHSGEVATLPRCY